MLCPFRQACHWHSLPPSHVHYKGPCALQRAVLNGSLAVRCAETTRTHAAGSKKSSDAGIHRWHWHVGMEGCAFT